ncbi:hypothetical protein CBER1_09967 [Cercospora berteroae]|uniref:Ferric reductase NAD binding domain-containing protein n=1 Tax=Cercospora berteroae TaxID=357750 RepID=A0A2S6C5Z1_9PEZI|nr:hypothetical protein CBER1_09967 [Cercospora berteroae]
MFASSDGIFAQLPFIRFLTDRSKLAAIKTRRIKLVWQTDEYHGQLQQWMQSIMDDEDVEFDLLDISIHVCQNAVQISAEAGSTGPITKVKRMGQRLKVIHDVPDVESYIQLEMKEPKRQVAVSGYWQSMPRGFSTCVNGSLRPFNESGRSLSHEESSFQTQSPHATSATQGASTPMMDFSTQLASTRSISSQPSHAPCEVKGETGNSRCTNQTLACRSTDRGVASYAVGGKMASMYDRLGGAFRCDIEPESSLYVAVWTPYNSSVQSQPRPESCGKKWTFTNPRTNASAVAMVVDRCASCVGVGRQTSDPTTADIFVNGATVDLSRDLWDLLYDGEPPGVYDIDYDGPVWLGTAAEPDILRNPNCGV